jgi:V-type H+-transporting ATPase subunit a
LNPELNAFQRKFTSEVRRCDEMERKIVYIQRELLKDDVVIPDVATDNVPSAPNPREMVDLEAQLEKTENEIVELSENSNALYQNFVELIELQYVLEKTQSFFAAEANAAILEGTGGEDGSDNKNLGFVAGVIAREKVIGFETMLWRISRGNVFLRQAEIDNPIKDPKTVTYIIIYILFVQKIMCFYNFRVLRSIKLFLWHSFKVNS